MSVKIRCKRIGGKNDPVFRIVVADSRSPRDGRFIEVLGTYDPMLPSDRADRVVLKSERVQYWLGVGAQPSDRVAIFCARAGLMTLPERPDQTLKPQPKKKAQARLQAAAAAS